MNEILQYPTFSKPGRVNRSRTHPHHYAHDNTRVTITLTRSDHFYLRQVHNIYHFCKFFRLTNTRLTLTVWLHPSLQTLMITTHLADVTRLPRDNARTVSTALILKTVTLFHCSSEETLKSKTGSKLAFPDLSNSFVLLKIVFHK